MHARKTASDRRPPPTKQTAGSANSLKLYVASQAVLPIGKPKPDKHPSKLMQPVPAYMTNFGAIFETDSSQGMAALPDESVVLVVTSPPYALHSKKEYGNADKEDYVKWFRPFGEKLFWILNPEGSVVLNIGGSYQRKASSITLPFPLTVVPFQHKVSGFFISQGRRACRSRAQ